MRIEVFLLWGAVLLSGCISVSSGERTVQETHRQQRPSDSNFWILRHSTIKVSSRSESTTSGETACWASNQLNWRVSGPPYFYSESLSGSAREL
jgi:hypothetical protein